MTLTQHYQFPNLWPVTTLQNRHYIMHENLNYVLHTQIAGTIANSALKNGRSTITFNCSPEDVADMQVEVIASQVDQIFQ